MNWDLKSLFIKIKELEKRIEQVSDTTQKYALQYDLINLKTMVNFLSKTPVYVLKNCNRQILDYDFNLDMVSFLEKESPKIRRLLTNAANLYHVPIKICYNQVIRLDEYDLLLKEFFESFNLKFNLIYEKYKRENRIEISRKKYDSKTCDGECRYILSEKECYISVRHINRLSTISILPHEIAHAEQFRNCDNIVTSQNKMNSLLCEAYPIFVEYAFIDFLKQTKYFKYAFKEEGNKINGFLCSLEYDLPYLNGKEFIQNKSYNTLLISHLVALYWLELYRECPNYLIQEIDDFNYNFGKEKVSEFFEKNRLEDVTEGMHMSLSRYLDNYR